MNRMRELMEKDRETRLADEEKQELQKHFVALAAHESSVCRRTELFAAMVAEKWSKPSSKLVH